MMTLILHFSLSKKKVIAMCAMLGIYVILLTLMILTNDTKLERMLYPDVSIMTYHQISVQMMKFVLVAMVAIISFDFHQPSDHVLYAYFSKAHVLIKKMLVQGLMIVMITLVVNAFRILLGVVVFETINWDTAIHSFGIMIDMLILWCLALIFSPIKYPQMSFLIVIVYVLIHFVQEDVSYLPLFYVFPFYHAIFNQYVLSFYYQITYVCLLFISTFLYQSHRSLI